MKQIKEFEIVWKRIAFEIVKVLLFCVLTVGVTAIPVLSAKLAFNGHALIGGEIFAAYWLGALTVLVMCFPVIAWAKLERTTINGLLKARQDKAIAFVKKCSMTW